MCFKRKGVAEAKIEVLEYVELLDQQARAATIYMCSICKKKMQIIF
jgi:hypothetical protein